MPVIVRPGWTYPADAGRDKDADVADSEAVVADTDGDGRKWITLLLGSPPYDTLVSVSDGRLIVRRVT